MGKPARTYARPTPNLPQTFWQLAGQQKPSRKGRVLRVPTVRKGSAFYWLARFGSGCLAGASALLGRRCRSILSRRSRSRSRRRFGRRGSFGFSPRADRGRQERCIERGRSIVAASRLGAARTAFGAGAQAATGRAGIAHERIVRSIGDGFAFDRGHAFARQGLGSDRSFGFGIAIAAKAAVLATTLATIFAGAVITLALFTGTIFTLAFLARTVVTRTVVTRTVIALTILPGTIVTVATVFATTFVTRFATVAAILATVFALFTLATGGGGAVERGEITLDAEFAALVLELLLLPALAAILAIALFFLAHAGVGDHAEIVIGKLQVVFGLDAVAIHMGVLRKLAILLEQLGGIAPGAAIDPVELLATILRTVVVTATATAVVTTIVIQLRHFLNWGGLSSA